MQPYVIKQGDHLALLAYKLGFDAASVWNDPSNAGLQTLRGNPNILLPGDLLSIPDQVDKPPDSQSVATGTTNAFVTNPPTVTVAVQFSDPTFVSQPYTVQELPDLTGLSTDGDGLVTFSAPVTLATATVTFTASGAVFSLQIGAMDPINTLSGAFKRLQNLGFIDPAAIFDSGDLSTLSSALSRFYAFIYPDLSSLPPPQDDGESSPASTPPVSTPNSPPSTPPASTPSASPASTPPPSAPPASTPPPSSTPPSAPPTSAAPDSSDSDCECSYTYASPDDTDSASEWWGLDAVAGQIDSTILQQLFYAHGS